MEVEARETAVVVPSGSSLFARKFNAFNRYRPTWLDVCFLGIFTTLAGQSFKWPLLLQAGFGGALIALLLVALAFLFCICCLAETLSALPVSGGTYAVVRCVISYYAGFVLGCTELFVYVISLGRLTFLITRGMQTISPFPDHLRPAMYFILNIAYFCIYSVGGRFYWTINQLLSIIVVGFILAYCLGLAQYSNISQNSQLNDDNRLYKRLGFQFHTDDTTSVSSPYFAGGLPVFMEVFQYARACFVFVESIAFTCDIVDQPRTAIPKALVTGIFIVITTGILIFFIASSQEEGLVVLILNHDTPLIFGYIQHLHISFDSFVILGLFILFGAAASHLFFSTKILAAMSASKLFPSWIDTGFGEMNVRLIAAGIVSFAAFICSIIMDFDDGHTDQIIYTTITIAQTSIYIIQLISYIRLKVKFTSTQLDFYNPLGVVGSVYSILIFLLLLISAIFFSHSKPSLVVLGVYLVIISLYYYYVAKDKQNFSDDERSVTFLPLVVQYNLGFMRRYYTRDRSFFQIMRNSVSLFRRTIATASIGMPDRLTGIPPDRVDYQRTNGDIDDENRQIANRVIYNRWDMHREDLSTLTRDDAYKYLVDEYEGKVQPEKGPLVGDPEEGSGKSHITEYLN